MPGNASAKNIAGFTNTDNMPVWEHRRRAGSGGSMDLGLFDGELYFLRLISSNILELLITVSNAVLLF